MPSSFRIFASFMVFLITGIIGNPAIPQADYVSDNNYYLIIQEDTIPLASTEKITATKEKILYHDANGYFRKSIITRISIVFNPCNEVRVRNNSNIRYLQHPNFDEKAIVRDSVIQVREAFDLPLMRFSELE